MGTNCTVTTFAIFFVSCTFFRFNKKKKAGNYYGVQQSPQTQKTQKKTKTNRVIIPLLMYATWFVVAAHFHFLTALLIHQHMYVFVFLGLRLGLRVRVLLELALRFPPRIDSAQKNRTAQINQCTQTKERAAAAGGCSTSWQPGVCV